MTYLPAGPLCKDKRILALPIKTPTAFAGAPFCFGWEGGGGGAGWRRRKPHRINIDFFTDPFKNDSSLRGALSVAKC